MTDVINLAHRLFQRIEWQSVPDTVGEDELIEFVADAIRYLYVMTGRTMQYSEDMFIFDGCIRAQFAADLLLDEQEYVLTTAEIAFYRKVQASVDDITSYTTDAMSVTHGDKPFANLQQKIADLDARQRMIWYKMARYNIL